MEMRLFGRRIRLDETVLDADSRTIREQLRDYEAGTRRVFELSLQTPDTFTGRVMAAMRDVPYGSVQTYGAIAEDLDTAPVAVGQAAGRNPIPIVVPCHRVVGASGLGGYSGAGGVRFKERLLRHEGVDVSEWAR